ncbi:hypothetical protein CQW23_33740 [Capsicum baccatum]|uniref:NB-ARC domain-containing protein n=1 Tax=Capsicum baccatum TaxID=33114 RepID=A0A2G2V0Z4_CAPBA|nr:hypothetical protein CQW23_33740 [Capsicum baccatum]
MVEMIEDGIKTGRIVSFATLKATTQVIQKGSGSVGGKKNEEDASAIIVGQQELARGLYHRYPRAQTQVFIIGVWEAGGVGKTTLVTNLNNELLKTGVLSRKLSFGVVIWVTMTKPPIDIRQVQAQIASRLNMKIDSEGSDRSIASKICERLEEETSFLLIMDDVGEAINLDDVGVPQLSARSKDIELSSEERSKRVNKKRGDIQSCFLYCSLYPAAIPIDDLIQCCWAEGILGEHDSYEEAYNRGITLIESLKDACLLEDTKMKTGWREVVHYVKMHDVARDVSRWIASTFGDEHTSVFQAGIGLTEVSSSIKRISFISNKIECLTDCFTKCPKTTSLLLQGNEPLKKIPQKLFLAFPDLRVLNLSETGIEALPSSINSLCQLRALIL